MNHYACLQIVRNLLVNETYVLYQCGTQAPSSNALPAGSKVFSIPLTSVAVLETVPIAFLVRLSLSRSLEMSRIRSQGPPWADRWRIKGSKIKA